MQRLRLAFLAAALPAVVQAQTIDNGTYDNVTTSGFNVFGQSFFAPTGFTFLQTFQFYLIPGWDIQAASFRAILATYNAGFGTEIYRSAPMTVTQNSESTPTWFTFNVGMQLDPTTRYVALVVPTALNSMGVGFGSEVYSGGDLVLGNSLTAPYELTAYDGLDASFRADFSNPVIANPEPGSIALMATGLAGIVGVARRRRAKAKQRLA